MTALEPLEATPRTFSATSSGLMIEQAPSGEAAPRVDGLAGGADLRRRDGVLDAIDVKGGLHRGCPGEPDGGRAEGGGDRDESVVARMVAFSLRGHRSGARARPAGYARRRRGQGRDSRREKCRFLSAEEVAARRRDAGAAREGGEESPGLGNIRRPTASVSEIIASTCRHACEKRDLRHQYPRHDGHWGNLAAPIIRSVLTLGSRFPQPIESPFEWRSRHPHPTL